MSFARCRRCKSPVNPERFPRCIGCGAEVNDTLPPSPRKRPNILQEGAKDAGRARGVFSVIGVLGIFGFFVSLGNGYLMILTGTMAVTGIFVWMGRIAKGKWDTAGSSILRIIALLVLCGVALLFGLGIILGFACVSNGGRFE